MEDWQNVNLIHSMNSTDEKVTNINKTSKGELWVKTLTKNKQAYWLVDTGSPRSFMNTETASKLLVNAKTTINKPNKSRIQMLQQQQNKHNRNNPAGYHVRIQRAPKYCTILLVDNNTIIIMGTDVMDQLGIHTANSGQQR